MNSSDYEIPGWQYRATGPAGAVALPRAGRGRRTHPVLHLAGGRGAGVGTGRRPQACQVTGPDSQRCPDQAEVKLADSLGDSVWACLQHADQILVTVPAAFVASHDDRGIATFLGRR